MNYDITSIKAPKMPNLGKGLEGIKLWFIRQMRSYDVEKWFIRQMRSYDVEK